MCMMESTYAIANSIAGVSGVKVAKPEEIKTVPGTNIQSDETEEFDQIMSRANADGRSLLEELREKLLQLNEEITQQEEQAENIDRFIGKVQKYLDLDELTPTVLNDMVKAVYVHAPDKSKGYREQQIDISYDLVGILPAAMLNDLQNGETA